MCSAFYQESSYLRLREVHPIVPTQPVTHLVKAATVGVGYEPLLAVGEYQPDMPLRQYLPARDSR